ncbi:MAG: hypothetical protein P8K09_05715 [Hyphomicrobiales bacterium]|nr:hypothetical protein [Hyphomicrobiales bacterium]
MIKLLVFHILILICPFFIISIFYCLIGKYSKLREIPDRYGYKLLVLGLFISITIFYLNPILSGSSVDNNYIPPYMEGGKIISGTIKEE